jgi:glycosyltransferase 2 family protein
MAFYADQDLVFTAIKKFNWNLLPVLLFLSLLNYFTRFLKWHYYLKIISIDITFKNSILVFFSGLVMSITPAKAGEILKPYLVNKITNDSIAKTLPVVFSERLTDFLGLIVLAAIGVFVFDYGKTVLIVAVVIVVSMILLIAQRNYLLKLFDALEKFKMLSGFLLKLRESYESAYKLIGFIPLVTMVFLSIVSWFFECFALYLILSEFNIDFSLLWTTFVYSFSTIAGALSILPGGVGVTEGSLTYLIHNNGFTMDISVLATFIVRVVTLWFAVVVGAISLFFLRKQIPEISETKTSE